MGAKKAAAAHEDEAFTITLVGGDEWDEETPDTDSGEVDEYEQDTYDEETAPIAARDPLADITGYSDEDEFELEPLDEDRDIDDFDFCAIVDSYSPADVASILTALEAEKPAYVKAAKKAGRAKPLSEFYNDVNVPLFRRRIELQERIVTLKGKRATKNNLAEISRCERRVEYLTELLALFNRPIARAYVRKFTSNTSAEDSADFAGAANVGLMHAIHTFDPDKGKFGSWVYKPLQRAVLKAVQQADFSNMTGGDFERRPAILKAFSELSAEDEDRVPSYSDVAARAGVTESLVKRVLAAPHVESLHVGVGEEGDTELGDLIPDDARPLEDTVVSGLEVAALKKYGLPLLDRRQRYVIVCRYGLHGEPPEALADIGKNLDLSREAVRQIAAKAMAHLTHPAALGALVRGGPPEE